MPCYCHTPDEDDQVEIERRCKERMYFDAIPMLSREQAIECEKRKLKQFPMGDINDHLCKICQVLTEKQMKMISACQYQIKWPYETLYHWHVQHCKDDVNFNNEIAE